MTDDRTGERTDEAAGGSAGAGEGQLTPETPDAEEQAPSADPSPEAAIGSSGARALGDAASQAQLVGEAVDRTQGRPTPSGDTQDSAG
jgi:hypothetical protein